MRAAFLRDMTARWRLPLLGVLVLAIVVVPFLVLRSATLASADAHERARHTLDVEASMHQLALEVRSLEVVALSLASGLDGPLLRARIVSARERIDAALSRVRRLSRDNPDQQLRLGELQSVLRQRMAGTDAVIAAGDRATLVQLDAMVLRYPIQPLIDRFVAEEHRLLARRETTADAATRRADMLTWMAMLAQLLLLGALAWISRSAVTQRIDAERHTRRASERASLVLDSVRDPIVLVDRELQVVMHNAAFSEAYGVTGVIRGTPLQDVGDGAWRGEESLRRLGDVLARDRELWDFEQVQTTVDGIERTMLLNARRMPLPDRDDVVALVTASDVSVHKAGERQIRELARQLEGKVAQVTDINRELEAFSYSVSHDLRAPLRHISGFADKLGRQLGDAADEKSRHYLEVIGSSARRMSTLIDDLLVYSRLGRSALRLQAVDMQSLVEDTRAMLQANAATEHPGHRIEWDIGALPVLVGDENMLRQVWLNLLGNAVKYSNRSEPAKIAVLHEQADNGDHQFSVRDNGAGFDMAYAGKLFGVFQRLHAASEYSGTGIGLASVKRVLMRHRGRIWAESAPGEGAAFHFILPANPDPSDARSDPRP